MQDSPEGLRADVAPAEEGQVMSSCENCYYRGNLDGICGECFCQSLWKPGTPRKRTNRERLASMTDEELAAWLMVRHRNLVTGKEFWLDWLRAEAVE